ncbi:hypothetical protein COJ46_01680 [Bacillus sp. AFS077874]|uniref:hypothetical protein n=1 Tax=unclassified Bacillus (in: firmicutes) TaxID=185979 RepID=UPI000BEDF9E8|nr:MULTISPECIES: hypothetical protein [unclassified Bacillus (in: firmicutes)]PEC50951.1 hypothetical protein CON00_04360 [Bacillus sp. AFS096315]PFM83257.1 hypothetical protein COJ46_01680 [Bacillus sp. AFS077874]
MKLKRLIILLGALMSLFFILNNVMAAQADSSPKKEKWKIEKQDLTKGDKPQPHKNLKPSVQVHKGNTPFEQVETDKNIQKERPKKADSLK